MVSRIVIMRHGHRFADPPDPELTERGFNQVKAVVDVLVNAKIDAIFCSPFVRAIQSAAPIAQALGLQLRVDFGLCELLASGWLYDTNPLPELKVLDRTTALNGVPAGLIDYSYQSPEPEWPDHTGRAIPGDAQQRAKCVARHGAALDRVISAAGAARTILIVGHGASHDYIPAALAPSTHDVERHSPACVDHVSLTTLLRDLGMPDGWRTVGWGDEIKCVARGVRLQLSPQWHRRFKWSKHAVSSFLGEEWSVDEAGRHTDRGLRTIIVLSPYAFVQEAHGHIYYLDQATDRVTVWDGTSLPQYEAVLA